MAPESPAALETICIVDDDASMRKALERMFRASRFEVETFESPAAFLARERDPSPSCAVLDLRMPGLDGISLHEQLRRAGRMIPVIFITGQGDVSSSVRAMKGGAIDFIEKPFESGDLIAAVRRALAASRAGDEARAQRAVLERRFASLTPREKEVFALVAQGLLNKLVADRLGTAEKTVKVHRARVMEKMNAGSPAELGRMAEHLGLVK
jgi:FixJ family two-component response regulator